jgi:hypothetical protein
MSPSSTPALIVALLCAAGCGGTLQQQPRFGVLEASWGTTSAIEDSNTSREIVAGMREQGLSEARALDAEPCNDDVECLRSTGESYGVERLVAPSLLALGTTVLLRASVIDVALGTRTQTRQEVIADASAARIDAAARALGIELARPHVPAAETPWYEQWWPWTIAGALVAGAAVAIAVGVLATGQGPDVVVRP